MNGGIQISIRSLLASIAHQQNGRPIHAPLKSHVAVSAWNENRFRIEQPFD